MRLTEAIQALLIATQADGRSRRTVTSYEEKLSHLVTFLGDVDVECITVDDLRRYVAYQMSEHVLFAGDPRERVGTLSPFTVTTRIRAMKRLFNWLEAEGRITTNPTRRIKTPRPKREEPKGITSANVRALLATASGDDLADVRDRAIILFLSLPRDAVWVQGHQNQRARIFRVANQKNTSTAVSVAEPNCQPGLPDEGGHFR